MFQHVDYTHSVWQTSQLFIRIGRGIQQHDLTKNGSLLSINSLVIHENMDVLLFQAHPVYYSLLPDLHTF